jgi:hypothetical protein
MTASQTPILKPNETNPYRWYAARFWHGMPMRVWAPLLWGHAGSIRLKNYGLAGTVTFASVINSSMSWLQRRIYSRRVAETKLVDAPIFIIGHWRSGTTLLHELMALDGRFTSPTTFQCMGPSHFLVSRWWAPKMTFMLPAQRPMDDMQMGWHRPQEDEFALCNMGIPSPYLHLAFPRDREKYARYLDHADQPREFVARWKRALYGFLLSVTFADPRRIVLKSPPHLARVATLLDLFPDARFVHIVRDPCAVFSSTMKLWKTLYETQSFQKPPDERSEEWILDCFERMYGAFERDRSRLGPGQLCEVRYEDLVHDPIAQMRAVYEQFELGGFESAEPKLAAYFESSRKRNFRVNQHRLDGAKRRQIFERWGRFMDRYGYSLDADAPAAARATA